MSETWKRSILLAVMVVIFAGVDLSSPLTAAALVGDWHLDDNSGTTATDSSAYGNDGTLINMTSAWVSGKDSYALHFDGTEDYINCGSDLSLNPTGAITIAAWIKLDESSGHDDTIVSRGYATDTGQIYWLSIRNYYRTVRLCWGDGTTMDSLTTIAAVPVGEWHHIAATFNSGDVKIYIDGVLAASKTSTVTSMQQNQYRDTQIGKYYNVGHFFDGILDEVKIYDYALSETLISNLAAGSLCGFWRFDEGTGTSTADDSANGNTGTLTNMATPWLANNGGYALNFDGTEDYVNCGSDLSLNPADAISITAWIKLDESSGYDNTIVSRGYATDTGQIYWLQVQYYYRYVRFYWGDGTTMDYLATTEAVPVGEWHHVAATFNYGEAKIYIDGVLAASKTSSVTAMQQQAWDTQIGKYYNVGRFFAGSMDEVKIYDYALSENVLKNMSDDLCGSWEMNEGSGSTVIDNSGNGNDGTLTNMNSCWVNGHLDSDGQFRTGLQFDGTEDYINCGSDLSLNPTDAITIAAWIKLDESSGHDNTIVSRGYSTDTGQIYWLSVRNYYRTVRFAWGDGTTMDYLVTTEAVPVGEWHHVAATFDSGEVKIYVDGVLAAGKTSTVTSMQQNQSRDTQIGKYYNVGHYFDGTLDKVKIYRRALDQEEIAAMQLLSAYSGRNYYTSEDGIAVSTLDITDDANLTGCYLIAKDSSGNSLGTDSSVGKTTDLSFDISSLSTGTNTITVELRRTAGEKVLGCTMDIVKKAANTGNEVKIDTKNSTVLRNGSGFFPIGLCLGGCTAGDTDIFDLVSDAGFNTVIRWQNSGATPSDSTVYLENSDDYGLLVIDRHEAYTVEKLSNYKIGSSQDFWDAYVDERDNIIDAVGYAKNQSNLLAYYTFDEPLDSQLAAGLDLYNRTNSEDGYHPTFVLYMALGIPDSDDYTNWCDVLGVDPYWIPPYTTANGSVQQTSVNWVAKWTYDTAQRAKRDGKALWMMPMAEHYSNSYKRAITSDEQRCQTFLMLIYGAKGIFYWMYPVFHESSWTALADIATDLNDLGPAMLTAAIEQQITYSSGETLDPANDEFPAVQVSLRKAPAAAGYDYILLAANTVQHSVDVDFNISLLGASGTVSRLFDSATYTVSDGEFSDTLGAHGTRAYTFSSSSTDSVVIDLNLTLPDPVPANEEVHPVTGRTGKTNMMQNPTLEDATFAKWPDYCRPLYSNPMINAANQQWGLETITDSTNLPAGHGGNCLKMTRGAGQTTNGVIFRLTPRHTDASSRDYTFSAYMKADVAGVRAQLGCGSLEAYKKTVILTTSWVRYEATFPIPANFNIYNKFNIWVCDEGTVYVDAIQVEQASSASTFTTN